MVCTPLHPGARVRTDQEPRAQELRALTTQQRRLRALAGQGGEGRVHG